MKKQSIVFSLVIGSLVQTAPVNANENLPRGNHRTPNGAVYYSDGAGTICGYASMNDYVNFSNAGWSNISQLPLGQNYIGSCTAEFVTGIQSNPRPRPPRPRPPQPAPQPEPALARANFRTPNGAVYFSNGRGAVCGYSSLNAYETLSGNGWTNLNQLPAGVQYAGPCTMRFIQGFVSNGRGPRTTLQPGNFRITSGAIFHSYGNGQVCSFATWNDYLALSNAGWSNVDLMPAGLEDVGSCVGPL